MSLMFWLGQEGALLEEASAFVHACQEPQFFNEKYWANRRAALLARQAECKPEADGFITVIPEL